MTKPAFRAAQAAAVLVCGLLSAADAMAQSTPPQLPPGISIGPRPPAEPGPGLPNAGAAQGGQGADQQPQQQDGPGCTYRENKLELLV